MVADWYVDRDGGRVVVWVMVDVRVMVIVRDIVVGVCG